MGARRPASAAIIEFLIVGSCAGVSLVGRNSDAISSAKKEADLARAQSRSVASARREARGSLRQPAADALLDGGGKPWALFAPGDVPQEPPSGALLEAFVPADPDDPVGRRCCPGDTQGYWYYNVSSPTVVPFIVEEGHPHRADAAIVVAPGGGNSFLAWNKEGTRIARWLNSIGFSAFVLKYRVPSGAADTYTKCIIDAQRAVSLVRHRALEFGLNTSRIGVMGFSAGGNLAAKVSCMPDRVYEPLDEVDANDHRPDFAVLVYASGEPPLAQHAPLTFIAIATDDQCVSSRDAEEYYAALQQRGSSHDELHVYAEGRHGYGDCSMYVEGYEWMDVCAWTTNARLFLQSQVLGIHPPLANLSGSQG